MEYELLSAWLDGELTREERATVESAVLTDPELALELDRLRETRGLVRDLARHEPPAGFLASLLDEPVSSVTDLDAVRRRRGARRYTAAAAGLAAAAAVAIAFVVPNPSRVAPTLATNVRVHQAGVAASGDPVSGLAPLASPMRFGR